MDAKFGKGGLEKDEQKPELEESYEKSEEMSYSQVFAMQEELKKRANKSVKQGAEQNIGGPNFFNLAVGGAIEVGQNVSNKNDQVIIDQVIIDEKQDTGDNAQKQDTGDKGQKQDKEKELKIKFLEDKISVEREERWLRSDVTGLPIDIKYESPKRSQEILSTYCKIKDYILLGLLGKGGMGNVYFAYDQNLNKPVVIKTIINKGDSLNVNLFRQEAQVTANLDKSPGVVSANVLDSDNVLGLYYVMDYIEGISLDKLVPRIINDNNLKKLGNNKIPEKTALIWLKNMLDNLTILHNNNPPVVHRDLKPANIMLDSEGKLVICDLGLAMLLGELCKYDFIDPQQILKNLSSFKYNCIGTKEFAPPEQLGGLEIEEKSETNTPITGAADIYALGATMFMLLTGELVYPMEDAIKFVKMVRDPKEPPRSLYSLRPDLNEKLCAIIQKMIEKDVKNRYQTVEEVISDLELVLRDIKNSFLEKGEQINNLLEEEKIDNLSKRRKELQKKINNLREEEKKLRKKINSLREGKKQNSLREKRKELRDQMNNLIEEEKKSQKNINILLEKREESQEKKKKEEKIKGRNVILKSLIECYEEGAFLGDYRALMRLGNLYGDGELVAKDFKRALDYYQKVVLMKNKEESYSGRLSSFESWIEEKDRALVMKILEHFAGLKWVEAMVYLGRIYLGEDKVLEAEELFKDADRVGSVEALWFLGNIYEEEQYGKKDLLKAFKMYHRAAVKGHGLAMCKLGEMYITDIAKGSKNYEHYIKEAVYWCKEARKKGYGLAMYQLGLIFKELSCNSQDLGYLNISTVEKDPSILSFNYFKEATKKDVRLAFFECAICYWKGLGTEKKIEKAIKLFEYCESRGDLKAAYNLGRIYESRSNYNKAKEYYDILIEKEDPDAMVRVGRFYEYGLGDTTQDEEIARKYYESAASKDCPEGVYHLARLFERGIDGRKDFEQAFSLYHSATLLGHKGSLKRIIVYYKYENYCKLNEKQQKIVNFWRWNGTYPKDVDVLSKLARYYLEGAIVPCDIEKGVLLYKEACSEKEEPRVFYKLGRIYKDGRKQVDPQTDRLVAEIDVDIGYAYECFRKAYELGYDELADDELGYEKVICDIADILFYDERGDYIDEAIEYYLDAAGQGDLRAMLQLGSLAIDYYRNKLLSKIYSDESIAVIKESKRWLEEASGLGNEEIKYRVGMIYLTDGVYNEDYEKGVNWLEQAAASGYEQALIELLKIYNQADKNRRDHEKIVKYCEQALLIEGNEVLYEYACLILDEFGKEKIDEAKECLKKVAEDGDVRAMIKLGDLYLEESDESIALDWYKKAEDNGAKESVVYAYMDKIFEDP